MTAIRTEPGLANHVLLLPGFPTIVKPTLSDSQTFVSLGSVQKSSSVQN
jgi:hypothetical protein